MEKYNEHKNSWSHEMSKFNCSEKKTWQRTKKGFAMAWYANHKGINMREICNVVDCDFIIVNKDVKMSDLISLCINKEIKEHGGKNGCTIEDMYVSAYMRLSNTLRAYFSNQLFN